jgi:hypothetical protein
MSFEASFSGSLILPKSPPLRDRPTYQRIATVRTTIKPAPAELRAIHLVLSGLGMGYEVVRTRTRQFNHSTHMETRNLRVMQAFSTCALEGDVCITEDIID